jgi:hypothetical protein
MPCNSYLAPDITGLPSLRILLTALIDTLFGSEAKDTPIILSILTLSFKTLVSDVALPGSEGL